MNFVGFNPFFYFRVGYKLGRGMLRGFYRVAIGFVGFVWTLIAVLTSGQAVDEGIIALVALALATVVPAAGLYAASFRTSLGAARLERSLPE